MSKPAPPVSNPASSVERSLMVRLQPADNVAVAVGRLMAGQTVPEPRRDSQNLGPVTCRDSIPPGHKIATRRIDAGQAVLKFGSPIGVASKEIAVGEHVHSHNLVDAHQSRFDWETRAQFLPPGFELGTIEREPSMKIRTFEGFDRGDGRVGTRNYVLIAARVNCSATVCHQVAARFPPERLAEFHNVDGIAIATHTTGCALQYAGLKHQMLGRVLRGYASHANVGACLMIGLGCEQTTPDYLRDQHRLVSIGGLPGDDPSMASSCGDLVEDVAVPMLTMQAEGGTRATIDRAEKELERLLEKANQTQRSTVDASHLRVALECGGSDGYSGVTANPAVGVVADRVIRHGGAAVLSETTEIYGAEHLLAARSRTREVAQELYDKIDWWKQHVAVYGGEIDNNPSIGNKAGGLTTITEKSLGAVAKSGCMPLEAVVDYAQPIPAAGLSVMDTPGFDPASVTGKVAGGCNMVLFTTGRGSCFGGKPVPVTKIASNSMLFQAMPEDMDLNAGVLLEGASLDEVGDLFFDSLLRYASGEKTCSEKLGLGDHEFVPWTVGPTL